MEYYMGRSLTNAMVNLGIDSSVEEAIYEVRVCGAEGAGNLCTYGAAREGHESHYSKALNVHVAHMFVL